MRVARNRKGTAGPVATANDQSPAEPTPLARLTIKVGPEQRWGAAEGSVPGDQAQHLITTFGILGNAFGILGCTCAGIAGAVLTLRSTGLAGLALAELILALAAAMLIAACSLVRVRQEQRSTRAEQVRQAALAQAWRQEVLRLGQLARQEEQRSLPSDGQSRFSSKIRLLRRKQHPR